MKREALALAVAATLVAAPLAAVAGDLTVTLRNASGAPLADAVVTVAESGAPTPSHYAQPLRMSQKNMQFSPFVLAIPVGAEVNFSNEDRVRHQIFSFSPAKKFELKLFGRDQSHYIAFEKVGTVALGCNIHDRMVAFIRITDAPYAQVTDASGKVVFRNLPAGLAQVRVWHPYLRAPANELAIDATIPKTGSVEHAFAAPVLAPQR